MIKKRNLEELSVEELEKVLLVKRRQSRLQRFQQLADHGRPANEALVMSSVSLQPGDHTAAQETPKKLQPPKSRRRKVMDALLLSLEIISLVGLIGVLVASYFNLKELNDEVSLAQQTVVQQQIKATPTNAPPIALALLPGGHTPPTAPGGAMPDVPTHLQRWVQPTAPGMSPLSAAIEVAPKDSAMPTRIVIPKINVNAPIVNGVGWDDLKKGVGHLPGSANPGERGNLYLAAHNDIYGEIFRHLEELEVGDEYSIFAGDEEFRYVVTERRIIEPTEVDVMLPTTESVATLQTCHPYLVDTHRLVVVGELAE